MAKDYVKYASKKRKPTRPIRYRNLFTIFLVVVIALALAGWIAAGRHQTESRLSLVHDFFHPKVNQKKSSQSTKIEAKNDPEEIHYDFYNELASMQIASPSQPHPAVSVVKQEKRRDLYVLRISKFKNENEAGQARLSLLLEGIEANVVKIGDSYGLQQGAYGTVALAKAGQKELQKRGVESVIEKG
jgi:cell division protein FtsN